MNENEIAKIVVDAAFKIHQRLGPGLFESVYQRVLDYELQNRGLRVLSKRRMAIQYDDLRIDDAFEADLIVNDCVIIELKSVESIGNIHRKQLLTYLRMANLRLGLLINFNVVLIKDGILRVANGMTES